MDTEARNELVERHLWLVRHIVLSRHYHVPGWDREDLVQEGTVGLIKAANDYDPDGRHAGLRFPTVAEWTIRRHLHEVIADVAEADTVPMIALEPLSPPAWLVTNDVTRPLDVLPELVATGPSVEEVVEARLDGAMVSETLAAALALLDERARFILAHRYGLGGDGIPWTCQEIGRALGVHKSTVCRAEKKALAILRAAMLTREDGVLVLRQLHASQQQRRRTRSRRAA